MNRPQELLPLFPSRIWTMIALAVLFVLLEAPRAGAQVDGFEVTPVCQVWQTCRPRAINNRGQVVGEWESPVLGGPRAFLWDPANPVQFFHDLGPGRAYGINDSGLVVGERPTGPFGFGRAVLWDTVSGGLVDIGGFWGVGVLSSQANAINNNGQVAGTFADSQRSHAFVWDSSNGIQDLSNLGRAFEFARGINDAGIVVGDGGGRAVFWNNTPSNPCPPSFPWTCVVVDPTPATFSTVHDLGPGVVFGINNNVSPGWEGPFAQMVGWTFPTGADLWESVGMIPGPVSPLAVLGNRELGNLGDAFAWAVDINNRGQVVGNSFLACCGTIGEGRPQHAFFWDRQGGMRDINPRGWSGSEVTAINDLGQIVGVGDGGAFLLTPAARLSYSPEAGYGVDGVNPDTGTAQTQFTFKTVYIHTANQSPAYVNICLDNVCNAMSRDTNAADPLLMDGDFTNGEQYTFTTTLSPGPHAYRFETSDGTIVVTLPATGDIPGPEVMPRPGDVDLDGDVDMDDLSLILAARNTLASGPNDPRDLNRDGEIDALDARILTTLCTRPRCATQ